MYELLLNSFCDVFRKKNSPIPRKGYREIQESPVKPAALLKILRTARIFNFGSIPVLSLSKVYTKFFVRKICRYFSKKNIERYRNRTCHLCLRRATLYPYELISQFNQRYKFLLILSIKCKISNIQKKLVEENQLAFTEVKLKTNDLYIFLIKLLLYLVQGLRNCYLLQLQKYTESFLIYPVQKNLVVQKH